MAYSLKKIQIALTTLVMITAGNVSSAPYGEACLPETCCSCSCGEFFVEAELLYLRAYEGGLSSVCDSTEISNFNQHGKRISKLTGKAHDPDFDWNAGFRVGAGYQFADSRCAIGAFWTHFDSNSSGGKHNRNEHRWKINFDAVDVLYGCELDLYSCFTLTPFGGLKYAYIDQKLHTHFLSTTNRDSSSSSSSSSSSCSGCASNTRSTGKIRQEFYGIGPLIGLDGDWNVGCGFSLYGNISLAILYGTFHVRSHGTDEFRHGTNINHTRRHTDACQTVVDAGLGVRWKTCICNNMPLVVQLGLEHHQYFNQNQFCSYGDLSLDGGSLLVGIGF